MSPALVLTGGLRLCLVALAGDPRRYDGPDGLVASAAQGEGPEVADVAAADPVTAPDDAPADPVPDVDTPEPSAPIDTRAKLWSVGAFIDTGYTFDHNFPDNHVDRGNYTSPRANEVTVHIAVAYVRHVPTDDEPWLLELAGQVGPAATALLATEPQAGGETSQLTGTEVWQHIGRANVGVRVPKVGTEFAVGVFSTPIAYFSFWSKDNWTFSTPWQLNGVPYVLMGGRISQPIGKKLVAQLWINNGWQTYSDVNRLPSEMLGVNYTPIDGLLLSQWVYFGPEDVDNRPRAWRLLSDTYVVYDVGKWAIAAIFDVGRERLTGIALEPVALWSSGTLSARGRVWTSRRERVKWDMSARAEAFWDRDGRMFGIDQLMWSGVYGNTVNLFDHVLLRLEYRYDRSSSRSGYFYRGAAVHDDDDGLGHDQHSLFFALTGYFDHAFATPRRR